MKFFCETCYWWDEASDITITSENAAEAPKNVRTGYCRKLGITRSGSDDNLAFIYGVTMHDDRCDEHDTLLKCVRCGEESLSGVDHMLYLNHKHRLCSHCVQAI